MTDAVRWTDDKCSLLFIEFPLTSEFWPAMEVSLPSQSESVTKTARVSPREVLHITSLQIGGWLEFRMFVLILFGLFDLLQDISDWFQNIFLMFQENYLSIRKKKISPLNEYKKSFTGNSGPQWGTYCTFS